MILRRLTESQRKWSLAALKAGVLDIRQIPDDYANKYSELKRDGEMGAHLEWDHDGANQYCELNANSHWLARRGSGVVFTPVSNPVVAAGRNHDLSPLRVARVRDYRVIAVLCLSVSDLGETAGIVSGLHEITRTPAAG